MIVLCHQGTLSGGSSSTQQPLLARLEQLHTLQQQMQTITNKYILSALWLIEHAQVILRARLCSLISIMRRLADVTTRVQRLQSSEARTRELRQAAELLQHELTLMQVELYPC